jgi:hypothetical protein
MRCGLVPSHKSSYTTVGAVASDLRVSGTSAEGQTRKIRGCPRVVRSPPDTHRQIGHPAIAEMGQEPSSALEGNGFAPKHCPRERA